MTGRYVGLGERTGREAHPWRPGTPGPKGDLWPKGDLIRYCDNEKSTGSVSNNQANALIRAEMLLKANDQAAGQH